MKDVVRFYIVCYWLTNLGVRVTGDQCYGVAYGDRNRSGEALANPSPFSQKHLDSLSLSVTPYSSNLSCHLWKELSVPLCDIQNLFEI
jgi:hypothetical protein